MKKITATLFIASLLITSVSVFGQPADSLQRQGRKGHDRIGIPDLTDAQTEAIKKIKTAHLKEILPLKNKIKEKKAQLQTQTTVDKPDMAIVNKTIEEIGDLKTQIMKKQIAMKLAIRNELTEDQRIMFDMHKGKRKGRKQEKQMHHKGPK